MCFSYPQICIHFFLVINYRERDNKCKQTFSYDLFFTKRSQRSNILFTNSHHNIFMPAKKKAVRKAAKKTVKKTVKKTAKKPAKKVAKKAAKKTVKKAAKKTAKKRK